ncbi:tetratricopeptide repeat protein [Pedobacter frigoris]|uniref:Tetratricopeptide repeat protein n=1 Tax=Pedobacter frigoris TaxID=2571272 RepID=A0A4U1CLN9_9SPHI|nr:tetratricopeptide repeat protein [Pedobacter frigoris]TKC08741.1 tetratricopeptide repeat protein [Pedobacter frigoris]
MAEDNRLLKVEILIQQQKFGEAEKFLADLLSEDASNIYFLSLLAEVKLQQEKFDEANRIIDNAIGASPDHPQLFYIKSRIAIHQDDLTGAEKHINQAISIYPYEAAYFALLANINLARKQFEEALERANQALEIDAENLQALNVRSTALIKLNRSEESFETIEGALREDPNNAYTHANYGWGLLEKGDHKKALEHYKEALKNDPTFEYAQVGMLEALKANNPVYRVFVKYSFWIGNLTAKYQWGVLIGFYIVTNVLRSVARNNETLGPYLMPLVIVLALIAFSTWIITPVSNLFLRFNKYGQLLLDRKQKMSSNFVAASLSVFLAGLLSYFILSDERFLVVAIFGFAMMVPFSVMFSPSKNKNSLLIYASSMALVGVLAISITFSTNNMFNIMTSVFIFGFVIFQWVANYLIIKEDSYS